MIYFLYHHRDFISLKQINCFANNHVLCDAPEDLSPQLTLKEGAPRKLSPHLKSEFMAGPRIIFGGPKTTQGHRFITNLTFIDRLWGNFGYRYGFRGFRAAAGGPGIPELPQFSNNLECLLRSLLQTAKYFPI